MRWSKYNFLYIFCCRLRSGTNNEYFNSFGAGSTKIGSLGVVTVNFPRLAMQSETKEEFLEKVSEMYEVTAKINNAKRKIISKRIQLGAAPLYELGYMAKQRVMLNKNNPIVD
jgi:ribonucleoside-triphosphate reductase